MRVADTIEPLHHNGEERNQPHQQRAVLLVMTDMLQTVAVLGIIEALVLDFSVALGNVIQRELPRMKSDTVALAEKLSAIPMAARGTRERTLN